jgi:hypothetical protein
MCWKRDRQRRKSTFSREQIGFIRETLDESHLIITILTNADPFKDL